jgi:sugar O-acyltransferase (sialic acid O-acetyltransferase NeuD family)
VQESDKEHIILGYSGHGIVVAEAAVLQGLNLKYYADAQAKALNPFKLEFAEDDTSETFAFWNSKFKFILGVGNNQIRARLAKSILDKGLGLATVIHPDSSISLLSNIGQGTFVARGVMVNPLCEIGSNVILNTGSSIDHECVIHDNVHIAPNAVLAGNVTVENGVFIGANAVVKQGVMIGGNAIIGAGAVIVKDVLPNTTMIGNPAKELRK